MVQPDDLILDQRIRRAIGQHLLKLGPGHTREFNFGAIAEVHYRIDTKGGVVFNSGGGDSVDLALGKAHRPHVQPIHRHIEIIGKVIAAAGSQLEHVRARVWPAEDEVIRTGTPHHRVVARVVIERDTIGAGDEQVVIPAPVKPRVHPAGRGDRVIAGPTVENFEAAVRGRCFGHVAQRALLGHVRADRAPESARRGIGCPVTNEVWHRCRIGQVGLEGPRLDQRIAQHRVEDAQVTHLPLERLVGVEPAARRVPVLVLTQDQRTAIGERGHHRRHARIAPDLEPVQEHRDVARGAVQRKTQPVKLIVIDRIGRNAGVQHGPVHDQPQRG